MATCSRPPSQACSPVNQGQLEPLFLPASPELGKVSLKQVIRLLWGLQSQVDHIEQTLLEQNKINQEVCTNVKNISQAVNVVKDGLAQLQLPWGPHTPEDQKPPAVKEIPWAAPKAKPIGKAQPFLGPQPLSSPQGPQGATPLPCSTHTLPPPSLWDRSSHPRTSTSAPSHFGAASSPLYRKAWVCLNQRQFPLDLEVLSFLLMNMTEASGAWAHPHLDQLGSHCALIQTMDEFKFFMLQMELDWNDAALHGQFAQGLHWEVQRQIATRERQPCTLRELQDASLIIDNALREERASHLQQGNKPGKTSTTPNWGASQVPANRPPKPAPSPPIPIMFWRKNATANKQKARHKFAKCRTSWKATPKEDKGKGKETAKTGKDSEYQLGKE
ncbi:Retrotransposon-derived protein PEG10 [Rhizoctonia solani]|uniref:Retrotransposon-derived protein PEG10 n=1 Tax=Rhizoctonia solani TaxID=456999 RepID=A0A8H8T3E1_9AGAM|nr:Retrotransposon-derived protein PEG10 [Rhizoctonia solani]QRW27794.1 Retrotransposon-derived protein PEG10 [Rhizoctonia solani]